MSKFLLGMLFGFAANLENLSELGRKINEREERKSKYVPSYFNRLVNRGTCYDEDWVWEEPDYKFRIIYVQVLESENGFIIDIDWNKNEDAIECNECETPHEVDLLSSILKSQYSHDGDVTIENHGETCWVNVLVKDSVIQIVLSNEKLEGAKDCRDCFNMQEANELTDDMYDYFSDYRKVEIINKVE